MIKHLMLIIIFKLFLQLCRNKKDGKQRAAQEILQKLHPHINSWGSLLRLYGSRSVKSFKEKKQLEQEITLLQGNSITHFNLKCWLFND